jgi:hypothetical protein
MLTIYTARASSLLYAAGVALMLGGRWREGRVTRLVWTLGCAMLCVHALVAYHFVHRWSHAHALGHTADQTASMVGVRTGAGVYLNYAVMVVWAADVLFWWTAGSGRYGRRSRTVVLGLHAFLLFMMFNATIVFAHGGTRYAGLAVMACLVGLTIKRFGKGRGRLVDLQG